MVGFIATSALAVLLGLQQAAAQGWGRGGHGGWGQAPPFNCPGNPGKPAPVCTEEQARGWDFSDLTFGQSCSSYDSMAFSSGWSYAAGLFSQGSKFRGRGLDMYRRGRHGEGCIVNDLRNGPGYSCGKDRSFNIGSISVVAEREVDVEVVFTQRSGTTCSQFARCGPQGTTIDNGQCADAVSVQFKHRGKDEGSCGFGISSISYASCTSTTTYQTTVSYSAPPTTTPSTTPAYTTPSTTPSTTPVSTTPSTTPVFTTPSTTPSTTTPSIGTSVTTISSVVTTESVSTVIITTSSTVISCDSTVPNCPASSTAVSTYTTVSTYTQPVVTTVLSTVLTTVCPVTATQTIGNSTVYSTFLTTSYIPTTVVSTAYSTVTLSTPPAGTSPTAPPPSGPGCPDSVPQCLNSWMHIIPQCKDNSDSACFCKAADYTTKIIDCLEAYSGADLSDAISYFQRICAPYANENPQPFTGVPSTITITASAPMTTITIQQPGTTATVTVPASSFSIPTAPQPTDSKPPVVATPAPPTTVINTPPPAAPTTVSLGTNSFTVIQPSSSTSPIAIATGAASKDFVSAGAVGLGALVAAVLAF